MGGVYGSILVHFPELAIQLPYFNQEARIGAGYEPPTDCRYITCIRQVRRGRTLSGVMKNEANSISPVLKINDTLTICSLEELVVGWFTIYKKEVYRIARQVDWEREAGFFYYGVEKLIGNDGTTEFDLPVQQGTF